MTLLKELHSYCIVDRRQPKITDPPVGTGDVIGGDVEFVCSATGRPMPTVEWRRSGGELPAQHEIEMKAVELFKWKSTLSIRGVTQSDEGLYVCVATNALGNDSAAAPLNIYGKPPTYCTHVIRVVKLIARFSTSYFPARSTFFFLLRCC